MWILDLDGVVWLANTPIARAPEAIERIRKAGQSIRFVTNNSVLTVDAYMEKFRTLGISAFPEELVTSSMAAASLLEGGERVYVIGGAGLKEQVRAKAELVDFTAGDPAARQVDVVIVGWDNTFTYAKLETAMTAITSGARFIATNTDPTYPTPTGLIPGAGAVVAAVETAAMTKALVAGKPNAPIAEIVRREMDESSVMVGDRYSTDGAFAQLLGVPFYLVDSGVVEEIPAQALQPARRAPALWDLVDELS